MDRRKKLPAPAWDPNAIELDSVCAERKHSIAASAFDDVPMSKHEEQTVGSDVSRHDRDHDSDQQAPAIAAQSPSPPLSKVC